MAAEADREAKQVAAGIWIVMRPITHRSWFGDANIPNLLDQCVPRRTGRFAVGPHAGYAFCGSVLAETYSALDPSVKTIFIMGPCHIKAFSGVRSTAFDAYQVPAGKVTVSAIAREFEPMSRDLDVAEHAAIMHVPFLKHTHPEAEIVPLIWGGRDPHAVTTKLREYFDDPTVGFVVSTDFCHWGAPFDYQLYSPAPNKPLRHILDGPVLRSISSSIEELDKTGMAVASLGSARKWRRYIRETGNTVCGAKPLEVLLEVAELEGAPLKLEWLRYAQSSEAIDADDMSVSYAAAISA